MPTGRGRTPARRTRAPRSPRARSPRPADGTSTALAALIQYGTSSGGHAAERQQRHVAGRLAARGRSASAAAPGRAGTAGTARRGRARAARAPRRAGSGRKRSRSMPTGRIATRRVVPGARDVRAELARDRRRQRGERQRRAGRRRTSARTQQVVAVQRHDDRAEPREQRGPRGQPEVGVHDVEPPAAVAAPQLARGARRAPAGPGRTRTARPRRRRAGAAPRPGRARTGRAPAARASGTCS